MKKLTFEKSNNSSIWNNFIENSYQGTVFLKTDFLSLFVSKYEFWYVKENDTILVGFPILFKKNQVISDPIEYFPYLSPVISKKIDEFENHRKYKKIVEIFSYGIENLSRLYSDLVFVTHPELIDIRAFLWFNYYKTKANKFYIEPNYTSVINLNKFKNFNEYMLTIRTLRKREFNKFQKTSARIYTSRNTEDIKSFLNLYELTFNRQNIRLNKKTINLLRNILEKCLISKIGYFLFSMQPNNYLSSAIFIVQDAHTAYYYFGASDPNYRKNGENSFLMLSAIKDAFLNKLQSFDFLGVNSPQRGDFKSSFNGELKQYYNLILNLKDEI